MTGSSQRTPTGRWTEKKALAALRDAADGWPTPNHYTDAVDYLERVLLGRKRQMHEYRQENDFMKSERVRLQRTIGDLRQKLAHGELPR